MKVEAILKIKGSQVAMISPDTTVETAIHRLKLENIGALVVSEDGQHVRGVISERDIVRGFAQQGPELLKMHVEALMTTDVHTCSRDDSVTNIMKQMTHRRVRHLPVVTNGMLCGIVSIGDVVKFRLSEVELEVNVLRDGYRTHSTVS